MNEAGCPKKNKTAPSLGSVWSILVDIVRGTSALFVITTLFGVQCVNKDHNIFPGVCAQVRGILVPSLIPQATPSTERWVVLVPVKIIVVTTHCLYQDLPTKNYIFTVRCLWALCKD